MVYERELYSAGCLSLQIAPCKLNSVAVTHTYFQFLGTLFWGGFGAWYCWIMSRQQKKYFLRQYLSCLQSSSSELSSRMPSSRDGAYENRHTLYCISVVHVCSTGRTWLLSAIVSDCSVPFSDCLVPFSDCSASRFRLLCAFSDCSGSHFRLLSNFFSDYSAPFSDCSVTFFSCSVTFPIAQQFFRLLQQAFPFAEQTIFFMLIHLNLTT